MMKEWVLTNNLDFVSEMENYDFEYKNDFMVVNSIFNIVYKIHYLKDQQANFIGVLLSFEEILQQNETQKLMNKMEGIEPLTEIIAGIAHQIRNSLTTLRGFVQYLTNELSQSDYCEYTGIIFKEIDSINLLLESLLDFSLVVKKHYKPIYLNSLLEEVVKLIKLIHPTKNIDFILLLDKQLSKIYLNKELIKQALLNLIVNAIQASQKSPIIEITTRMSANRHYQLIRIKDNGIGIKKEIVHKIFMPFFTTKPSGTGLGLSFVKRIILLHHGIILIKKNDNNEGVTVEVALPCNEDL